MPNLCIVPARAVSDERLTPRDLRALLAIGCYTNRAGENVFASQRTLAVKAHMTRPQMNECIQRLVELGYVRKVNRVDRATGKTMTCVYDLVLDDPVPDLGTGGVPKTGTQNVVAVERSDDDDAARVMQLVEAEYRRAVATLLGQARHPQAVARELVALNNGMHGTFPWTVIGRACHDMVVAGSAVSPRALRAFCEGAASQAPNTPASRRPKRGLDLAAVKRQLDEQPPPSPQPED